MKIAHSERHRLTPFIGPTSGESESGPFPASLLLISAVGAGRAAVLRALGFEERCIQPCMEDRARRLDGMVWIKSAPGQRTAVQATLSVAGGRR